MGEQEQVLRTKCIAMFVAKADEHNDSQKIVYKSGYSDIII
jgi:hypothetical protein